MDEPTRARGGKVTIRTVAADAGVSVAAVSKVLRNAYGVSDALRQNVLASIERLGYRPSVAARAMRGRTHTIGILLVEVTNPFIPEILDGIESVLGPSAFKSLMAVGRAEAQIETSLIDTMIDYRVEGLVLVTPRLSGGALARYARQVPLVVIGHHEPDAKDFDTINSDDRAGAQLAVEALLSRGHRDIAMIALPGRPDSDHGVSREREAGYLDAMAAAGLSDRARITYCRQRGEAATFDLSAFLDVRARPSAVFCWSDLAAVPLINIARTRGVRVPEDLAIVGYDNSAVAALPLIGVASIDQAGSGLGATAATVLIDRIEGRDGPRHILLPPRLVTRPSI